MLPPKKMLTRKEIIIFQHLVLPVQLEDCVHRFNVQVRVSSHHQNMDQKGKDLRSYVVLHVVGWPTHPPKCYGQKVKSTPRSSLSM